MKILAIDTSSKRCSVAILEDDKVLTNLYNDDEKTHSVKLMPMVDDAFANTELSLDDINLLSCCIGPGSFTGVRIGISTVKAFADVKNILVVGISSLESLAYNVKDMVSSDTLVCSLIDAKNQNTYCGLYYFKNGKCVELQILAEDINTTVDRIIAFLKEYYTVSTDVTTVEILNPENSVTPTVSSDSEEINKNSKMFNKVMFVGNGATSYKEIITSSFEKTDYKIEFALDEENMQNGISLALAGWDKYKGGKYGDSSTISPIYLRKPQAERALEEKIQISEMTENDIKEIEPILNSEFDNFWNINNLKNDFENENSVYFVARLNNQIVGFAGILKICDESNIMNIVTRISKRHLGIGSKLLQTLIAKSKELGCTSITLEVNEHNTNAINLYKKFNFKRIGLRKKYYNNTDDAILMQVEFRDRPLYYQ